MFKKSFIVVISTKMGGVVVTIVRTLLILAVSPPAPAPLAFLAPAIFFCLLLPPRILRRFIPPHLGYGDRQVSAQIGANSTLIFEVELLGIQ